MASKWKRLELIAYGGIDRKFIWNIILAAVLRVVRRALRSATVRTDSHIFGDISICRHNRALRSMVTVRLYALYVYTLHSHRIRNDIKYKKKHTTEKKEKTIPSVDENAACEFSLISVRTQLGRRVRRVRRVTMKIHYHPLRTDIRYIHTFSLSHTLVMSSAILKMDVLRCWQSLIGMAARIVWCVENE